MKPKTRHLRHSAFSAAAITLMASPFSQAAQITLLSDNFNTGADAWGFNDDGKLTADQSGSLANQDYNIAMNNWSSSYAYQRGNAGMWLMYADGTQGGATSMYGSVNENFATATNTNAGVMKIEFNMSVSGANPADNWASFAIGDSQNQFVNNAANKFSSLFRDNGGTQQFSNGGEIGSTATFADGNLITVVLSNAAGTGSAFNSDGTTDVAKLYVNGTLAQTWTNLNLTSADGNISFSAQSKIAQIDNLKVANEVNGWTKNTVTNESFQNINYDAVSIFEWDLATNKDTDTGARGTDYDAVSVSGALTISDNAIFKVIQNAGLDFTDTFWDTNQEWSDIFTKGSLTGGWSANTAVSVFNTSGGTVDVSTYGSFTVSGTTLTWTAVPEPTSALAGLLITAGLLRRRRAVG